MEVILMAKGLVLKQCVDAKCNKVCGDGTCASYDKPVAKFRHGNTCPLGPFMKAETVVKINPLKASKRSMK
jgi:hypothetical protein